MVQKFFIQILINQYYNLFVYVEKIQMNMLYQVVWLKKKRK